jgi:hypothetical protein
MSDCVLKVRAACLRGRGGNVEYGAACAEGAPRQKVQSMTVTCTLRVVCVCDEKKYTPAVPKVCVKVPPFAGLPLRMPLVVGVWLVKSVTCWTLSKPVNTKVTEPLILIFTSGVE